MIQSIFITEKPGAALRSENSAEVTTGAGIVGDRNHGRSDHPGQNVTFIEEEAVTRYNAEHEQSIEASSTRRNIVTRGVDLNALVGKEFSIGQAMFKGIELCDPCATLGTALANQRISSAQVVKAFLTSGGLRADVVSDGVIAVGMAVETQPDH